MALRLFSPSTNDKFIIPRFACISIALIIIDSHLQCSWEWVCMSVCLVAYKRFIQIGIYIYYLFANLWDVLIIIHSTCIFTAAFSIVFSLFFLKNFYSFLCMFNSVPLSLSSSFNFPFPLACSFACSIVLFMFSNKQRPIWCKEIATFHIHIYIFVSMDFIVLCWYDAKQYAFSIRCTDNDPRARFILCFTHTYIMWLHHFDPGVLFCILLSLSPTFFFLLFSVVFFLNSLCVFVCFSVSVHSRLCTWFNVLQ